MEQNNNEAVEEVKQEEEATPVPVKEDRHQSLDPIEKQEEVDINKLEKQAVMLPADKYSVLMKLIDFINGSDAEDFKANFSSKQKAMTGINLDTVRLTTHNDTFANNIDENYANDINYGEGTLNMKHIKVRGGGAMTGNAAVAKFSSALGIGENTNVPLWHSGIWVTLKPPRDTDIINLEIALANNEIKIGKDTNTLVYSNYSVVFNRIVTDFIVAHIVATSVKLPDDVDIRDIIMVQDLYTLIVGLISTIYPDGYPIIRNCKNTLVIENKVPKCDFTLSGDVDPMKLLWVNKKALSNKALEHMSLKRPDSTTLSQVKEYQLSLDATSEETLNLTSSNGINVKMIIKSPTLSQYIDNGEEWIDNITLKSEELFSEGESEESKNKKISEVLSAVVLGVYNPYVISADLEDGTVVTERSTINSVLDLLSSDEKILNSFIDGVKKHIDTKAISIIATPAYVCPKCKADNVGEGKNSAFKEFLPLNVLEHFFDLGALRTSKIRKRSIY